VEEIQQTVVGPQGLLLEYFLGLKDGYVVVVPAPGESPRIERLSIDETQAKILGVKPGPLTGDLMHAILNFNSGGGERKVGTARGRGLDLMDDDRDAAGLAILPLLRRADHAMQAVDKLAALWQVLIPKTEREAIVSGKLQRLVIVPDGALAPLPFEVLVVESGAQPKYLLDAGPAIVGGPSATLLLNLSKERATVKNPQRQVLSVGDANYGPAASAGRVPTVLAQLTARSRYGALHDQLQPLPFTGLECTWVADNFKGQGMDAGILRKDAAREASVRLYAPGCRVLHFACHGLTDQRYGNLFGALALTPGPDAVDANDDGFLTLAEIYALDLRGCDLAILSACDTNYGPQEWGEGVWSLSRGFIVAGSQRVVASSWLVDDEAAASLVSVFCSSVAKEQKAGTPDYADALQKAKRWVRNQEKWSSPFYWGTFVLVGPN
jgi:CHAT domain-containing protein